MLLLEDLYLEEREVVEEVVMCMLNVLRVGDWYEVFLIINKCK